MARRTKTIQIEGMVELTQQINRLKSTAVGADVQAALLQAARDIRDEAAARAPIAALPTFRSPEEGGTKKYNQPGGLRKALTAAVGRQHKTFLQAFVFTPRDAAFYAHMVHNGTNRHVIKAKRMAINALNFMSPFGPPIRNKVTHPGSKPNPFLTKAIRARRNQIKAIIEAKVKAAFDALARTA